MCFESQRTDIRCLLPSPSCIILGPIASPIFVLSLYGQATFTLVSFPPWSLLALAVMSHCIIDEGWPRQYPRMKDVGSEERGTQDEFKGSDKQSKSDDNCESEHLPH
jgi:hypothetical protein